MGHIFRCSHAKTQSCVFKPFGSFLNPDVNDENMRTLSLHFGAIALASSATMQPINNNKRNEIANIDLAILRAPLTGDLCLFRDLDFGAFCRTGGWFNGLEVVSGSFDNFHDFAFAVDDHRTGRTPNNVTLGVQRSLFAEIEVPFGAILGHVVVEVILDEGLVVLGVDLPEETAFHFSDGALAPHEFVAHFDVFANAHTHDRQPTIHESKPRFTLPNQKTLNSGVENRFSRRRGTGECPYGTRGESHSGFVQVSARKSQRRFEQTHTSFRLGRLYATDARKRRYGIVWMCWTVPPVVDSPIHTKITIFALPKP
ncbi:hypothetical protein TcasGA2_TC007450 [Tribolium castaneum]|uniref:Uncharacterized protein n=1 Tax=Tribolium castaneum TaxID=7070 RepID=D1ZZI1_TRICA|nr:hypothetical protein TcasGA2_TC007450 [Tribolium castaneum]